MDPYYNLKAAHRQSNVKPEDALKNTPLRGVNVRSPYDSELGFFKSNKNVAGMATEDDAVIVNPYSGLDGRGEEAIINNEKARVYMRTNGVRPNYNITNKQQVAFSQYGMPQDIRETIASRILTNDHSALDATPDQRKWVAQNITPAENLRQDGTAKANGFLGVLGRPDGNVSTEISVGVNFDGQEREIPLLVPTLTQQEINLLLSGQKETREILKKAVEHAQMRLSQGKSPFAEPNESPTR